MNPIETEMKTRQIQMECCGKPESECICNDIIDRKIENSKRILDYLKTVDPKELSRAIAKKALAATSEGTVRKVIQLLKTIPEITLVEEF